MHRTRKIVTLALAVSSAAAVFTPSDAHARKKGVLEGEPIVRKKLQLRRLRFQVAPVVGMSLSQPFVHEGYLGAKVAFHITEWLGVRASFLYGIVNLKSQLHKDLVDVDATQGVPEGIAPNTPDPTAPGVTCQNVSAPCRLVGENDNPSPLRHDFKAGLTHAQWQSSADVVFTPFNGKLGLFSALFTEYDIYLYAGLGIMGWQQFYENAQSTAQLEGLDIRPQVNGQVNPFYCRNSMNGPQNSECILHPVNADDGVKLGFSFGGGLNLFISDWAALNLEVQDIVTRLNLTGLNGTVDDVPPVSNGKDKDPFHNVTLQVGARFYVPFRAKRSK